MRTLSEMTAFVRVVDLGSFVRAADDLRLTPSALSKLMARLEDRLGVRLLNRTTRRLALTAEGHLYLERARVALDAIAQAEADIAAFRHEPRGLLRINSSTGFARQALLHALPAFLDLYPDMAIDLSLTDRLVDPVAEGVDMIIRGSPTANSELVERQLGAGRRIICAAPSYLEKFGAPRAAADMEAHNCLVLSGQSPATVWPLASAGGVVRFLPKGNFSCDNVGMLFDMAVNGAGIVRLADFVVGRAIASGALVEILADINLGDPMSLWALTPKGRFRSPRVRAFLDFMSGWLERSGEPDQAQMESP